MTKDIYKMARPELLVEEARASRPESSSEPVGAPFSVRRVFKLLSLVNAPAAWMRF